MGTGVRERLRLSRAVGTDPNGRLAFVVRLCRVATPQVACHETGSVPEKSAISF